MLFDSVNVISPIPLRENWMTQFTTSFSRTRLLYLDFWQERYIFFSRFGTDRLTTSKCRLARRDTQWS